MFYEADQLRSAGICLLRDEMRNVFFLFFSFFRNVSIMTVYRYDTSVAYQTLPTRKPVVSVNNFLEQCPVLGFSFVGSQLSTTINIEQRCQQFDD